jgi:hypothetical protein
MNYMNKPPSVLGQHAGYEHGTLGANAWSTLGIPSLLDENDKNLSLNEGHPGLHPLAQSANLPALVAVPLGLIWLNPGWLSVFSKMAGK